jgi:hypothetical protein
MLDLLLLCENLLVEQVNLLSRSGIVIVLGLLARSRGFTTDVVERVLAVGTKLGMFEFPGLGEKMCVSQRKNHFEASRRKCARRERT